MVMTAYGGLRIRDLLIVANTQHSLRFADATTLDSSAILRDNVK